MAETVTWTLLIVGLVLKYGTGTTDLGVRVAGPIHGFVFLAFAAVTVLVGIDRRWRIAMIALGIVSAVVPYATVPFERWVDRRGLIRGGWRHERSTDGPDRPIDRILRVLLARPLLSSALALVAVASVFVVLLVLGPPGGR